MKRFLAASVMLLSGIINVGQAAQRLATPQAGLPQTHSQQSLVELPRIQPKPPKITMQHALKLAEGYVRRKHIDTSSYYLFEAKFILYGNSANDPRWYFWWNNTAGTLGNYIELTVSMDGEIARLPSM